MEDPVPYGKRPSQKFTVYKFEVNPINPEISRVYSWKNLKTFRENRLNSYRFIGYNQI